MVATIEERISAVLKDTKTFAPPAIEIGSDEYLDKVLYFKGAIEGFTTRLSALSADIIVVSNRDPQHSLDLLTELKSLHVTCLSMNDSFKKGPFGKALKTTLENHRVETRNLREVIDDITNIHVSMKKDAELQSLFSQL